MADDIRLHQRLARTGTVDMSETFGAESPFKPVSGKDGSERKSMKDHERAIPKTKGFHPQPDHGPQDYD